MPDQQPTRCLKCRRIVHPMELYPNDAGCGCAPRRIQRQRTRGWRMPEGAIYVGRPTKWGNPFIVTRPPGCELWYVDEIESGCQVDAFDLREKAMEAAVREFRSLALPSTLIADAQRELRGCDLACWCPLDQPCHADVLLEIANA